MIPRNTSTSRVLITLPLLAGLLAIVTPACGDDEPPQTIAEGIHAPFGAMLPAAEARWKTIFEQGERLVGHKFTPEEGLGPRFTVVACGNCHERPVLGGSAPRYRSFYIHHYKLGEGQYANPPADPQGHIVHMYDVREGAVRPEPNDRSEASVFARRNPLPIFGMGLIAEIDPQAIAAGADPDDRDGDGVSGRVNCPGGFIGRFGRKAQNANIEAFIRGPVFNHLGITNDPLPESLLAQLPVPSQTEGIDVTPYLCTDASTNLQVDRSHSVVAARAETGIGLLQAAAPGVALVDDDGVPDPELPQDELFALVSWNMLLAVPPPSAPTPESTRGNALFTEMRCTSCHRPTLPAPRGLIPLYSDLLLHDMGPEMSDELTMSLASPTEFRTQPLWGVSATGPWLHDGRASSLDEAIRWHGGEGSASRQRYLDAPDEDRQAVLAFLRSLGGEESISEGRILKDTPIPPPGDPGAPRRPLDEAEARRFLAGRADYDRDISHTSGMGLPGFNGDSCRACHFEPVFGGAGPLDVNVIRYGRWLDDAFITPGGGTILHRLGAFPHFRPEPDLDVDVFEPRQTPTNLGLGLIDEIAEAAILAHADPDDRDGDGVRGFARRLSNGALGRFGWKGQIATVRDFVRDALSAELGLTLPDEPFAMTGILHDDDGGPDPEVGVPLIDSLTEFLLLLDAPHPKGRVPRGEQLFAEVGCATCHVPSLPGKDGPVRLYSDLLLHDVQPPGYRGIPEDEVSGRLFRTPPLWGVGDTAPYLHDGRATDLRRAIELHFAEADRARTRFLQLSSDEQNALLDFLRAL